MEGKRVLMVLGSAFEDAEAAIALDTCGWTKYRPSMPLVDVDLCAHASHVEGRFGLAFDECLSWGEVDPDAYDGLIVPGGFRPEFDEIYCEDVYRIIRSFADQDKPIATMCVGVIAVARAGVMEGGFATTYEFSRHSNYAMIEAEGCEGRHESVCDWENILSCSGPRYSDEVMSRFMEKIVGDKAAQEIDQYRGGITLTPGASDMSEKSPSTGDEKARS